MQNNTTTTKNSKRTTQKRSEKMSENNSFINRLTRILALIGIIAILYLSNLHFDNVMPSDDFASDDFENEEFACEISVFFEPAIIAETYVYERFSGKNSAEYL